MRLNRTRGKAKISKKRTRKKVIMKGGQNIDSLFKVKSEEDSGVDPNKSEPTSDSTEEKKTDIKPKSEFLEIKECVPMKNIGNSLKGIAITKNMDYIIANAKENCIEVLNNKSELSKLTDGVHKEHTVGFKSPKGVAVDKDDNILVSDSGNNRICRILLDSNRTVSKIEVVLDSGLSNPTDLIVDDEGTIYVADTDNNDVKVIEDGKIVNRINSETEPLRQPQGLAFGLDDKILIADTGNHCIREVSEDNSVKVIAGFIGKPHPPTENETNPLDGRFNQPIGIEADSMGNIFIADYGNNAIRVYKTNKTLSTISLDSSPHHSEETSVDSDSESDDVSKSVSASTLVSASTPVSAPTPAPSPEPVHTSPPEEKEEDSSSLSNIITETVSKLSTQQGGEGGSKLQNIKEPYGIVISKTDLVITENNTIRVIKNVAKNTPPTFFEKLFKNLF